MRWLIVILVVAAIVRLIWLTSSPPSLSWDETASAYDAWSIAETGTDQWGKIFPYLFQSFGENKYPVHIYLTAAAIKIFGLSDWVVKLPSVVAGIIAVWMVYLITVNLSQNRRLGLIAAGLMAISPVSIQFSRMLWEANFGLTLFLIGVYLFTLGLKKPLWWVPAFLTWSVVLYTYNAAKVFLPLWIFLATIVYFKQVRAKIWWWIGVAIFGVVLIVNLIDPAVAGRNRYLQVAFPTEAVEQTQLFQLTSIYRLGQLQLTAEGYLAHLSPQFLFLSGDSNPRHSTQKMGEMYLFELVTVLLGLVIILRQRQRWQWLVLGWLLLGPVPAAVVKEAPHATRSVMMLGAAQIISAMGVLYLFDWLKRYRWSKVMMIGVIILVVFYVGFHLEYYFKDYPQKYSQEFQWGYHQLFANYQTDFNDYDQVVVSSEYGQGYIFGLYGLRVPADQFRQTVRYNPESEWGFSTVAGFDKFIFTKVSDDVIPMGRSLVFATPSERLDNGSIIGTVTNKDGSIAFKVYQVVK